jgi:hypothetical protein
VTASSADLIKAASDPVILGRLPKYAQSLIRDLARRLQLTEAEVEGARKRYAAELDTVRAELAGGPADADTYVEMPKSIMADETRETTRRPLGKGVTVEFRAEGNEEGEGFEVYIKDETLHVESVSRLCMIPSFGGNIEIEAR